MKKIIHIKKNSIVISSLVSLRRNPSCLGGTATILLGSVIIGFVCFILFNSIYVYCPFELLIAPIVIYNNPDKDKDSVVKENKGKSGIYRWVHIESGKSYVGDNYLIGILRSCLVEYCSKFNFFKLALGVIIFRILLTALWLFLIYLFDICNLTCIEPLYLIWTFVGLLIFNSIYKSYKVSLEKAILCFLTLVLNLLVIYITLNLVFYLLCWLNICVNDNPTWKLNLLGFSLHYALCIDPLSENPSDIQGSVGEGVNHNPTLIWVLWDFNLNYTLSMIPAIHLADYYDCQTDNTGSLEEGGGGPQIPQGLTPFDQSSDSNLEQENDKVSSSYPKGEDGSPPISTTGDPNFWSNSLKNFLSNIFGLDLFKYIIDSKIHDTKVVYDWRHIQQSPAEMINHLTCSTHEYSVLANNFNLEGGVGYTWVKDLNSNKHFLYKLYENSYEELVFEVISKDSRASINLGSQSKVPVYKYTGSSVNTGDVSSNYLVPQTHYTSNTTASSSGTYFGQNIENSSQLSSPNVMEGLSSSSQPQGGSL